MKYTIYVHYANSFCARLRGLMFRRTFSGAIAFANCRVVHTFFVRFPINIVCCDADRKVIAIERAFGPWRVFVAPRRTAVLIENMTDDPSVPQCVIGDEIEGVRVNA